MMQRIMKEAEAASIRTSMCLQGDEESWMNQVNVQIS
jgi:hypothetical protein